MNRKRPLPGAGYTLIALLAPVGACGEGPESGGSANPPPGSLGEAFAELVELASPASPGSITPYLSLRGEGDVYLSWQEPDGEGHAFRMTKLTGSRWGESRTIARGEDFFVNWADFPSVVALPDGSLAAHWLQREGPATYAYGVRIVRSRDGGRTWSEPVTPHLDGTETEHGFVSLFPAADGFLAAVWLDGRDFARAAGGAEERAAGGPPDADMSVRYAELDAAGHLRNEALLDARACDCCQTSAALTSVGPLVVYRDRSDTEIRDIASVRLLDGRWTAPATVHADGWHIPACPVNGPAVAADGDLVAVAWFTAANDEPKVLVAHSDDAGASFGPPLRIDDGEPLGRVDVALLRDGSALVLWLETAEGEASVRARRVRADGATSTAATVALTDVGRSSGFPRITLRGAEVILAWTDAAGEGSVRTAIAALPSPIH